MLNFPIHASMKDYVKALNAFYLSNKALWEVDDDYSGFRWINADDADYRKKIKSFCFNVTPPEFTLTKILETDSSSADAFILNTGNSPSP